MNQPYPPRRPGPPPRPQQPGYTPPPQWREPSYRPPAPSPAPKKTRKWPWVVGGVVALIVVAGIAGGRDQPSPAATAAAPTTAPVAAANIPPSPAALPTPAAPVVTNVTLPEVKGRNGGIVYDELTTQLGLTNLRLASRDEDDAVVLLPQNWTAVSIEPRAGTKVRSDQIVVVTMTKE